MDIFSSTYQVLRDNIYRRVPEISCQACGECCVSPHMTLIEFCYMMTSLLDKPEQLERTISRIVPRHPIYPELFTCRFQTPDNLCGVYSHRVLACRLHGYPVLEKAGFQYHVHCKKVEPTDKGLAMDDIYELMDRITELNQVYYSHYTPPYWVACLNTESWMTILFTEIPQNVFRLLRNLISRELGIQNLSEHFTQRVTIEEKLAMIDLFQADLYHSRYENYGPILTKIQNDFPDTGAYYYFEAKMYKKALA